jgi:hypothetical protein
MDRDFENQPTTPSPAGRPSGLTTPPATTEAFREKNIAATSTTELELETMSMLPYLSPQEQEVVLGAEPSMRPTFVLAFMKLKMKNDNDKLAAKGTSATPVGRPTYEAAPSFGPTTTPYVATSTYQSATTSPFDRGLAFESSLPVPMATQPPGIPAKIEIKPPPPYDGRRDSITLNNFRFAVKMYYEAVNASPTVIRTTFHNRLTDQALLWYQRRYNDQRTRENPQEWTLDKLCDDLVRYFKPLGIDSTAYSKLAKLEFKPPRTMTSLLSFNKEFSKLALAVNVERYDIAESEIMRMYRTKLAAYESVFRKHEQAFPFTSWNDMIRCTEDGQGTLDLEQRALAADEKTKSFKKWPPRTQPAKDKPKDGSTTSANKLSTPAQRALDKTKDKKKKLSADERAKYLEQGKCFACSQTGHIASDEACPRFGRD